MKKITLCADDFAIHPAASEAILRLAELNRIQGTSCLVTSNRWISDARLLPTSQLEIGLHLNFTEGCGLSPAFRQGFPSLGRMLVRSHIRALNYSQVKDEVLAQYQAFVNTLGRSPDFIDGHQHVHQLPIVRKALFSVVQEYSGQPAPWFRSVFPLLGLGAKSFKSLVIISSGAVTLKKTLETKGIQHNCAFAGVYSLDPKQPFPELMRNWLAQLPNQGLIMSHPAKLVTQGDLDHSLARLREYEYLSSEQFLQDCKEASVTLAALR